MFGIDFYPTPPEVIADLLSNEYLIGKTVLEPSAGKGNIVDFCKDAGAEVIACEIDANLRQILSNKCRVICSDFLKLTSEQISHVDYIIMNPPFSLQEQHILHAYNIAPPKCKIISICNNALFRNTYGPQAREIVDLVSKYGYHISKGNCFSTAERKTNVDIGFLYITKQGEQTEWSDEYFNLSEDIIIQEDAVIGYDYITEVVSRYVAALKMFEDVAALNKQINEITQPLSGTNITFGAKIKDRVTGEELRGEVTFATYKKELQKNAWRSIFDKMDMAKYITTSVKEDINKYVEQQTHIPFTRTNIYRMMQVIAGTHNERMDKVITDAFDYICGCSPENSTGGSGWKTNSNYMVNKRFIMGGIIGTTYNGINVSYYRRDTMDDIARAICYITGVQFSQDITLDTVLRNAGGKANTPFEWLCFKCKAYKVGTLHLEFKDDRTWAMFNQRVAKIKGWRLTETMNKGKRQKK